MASRYCDSNGQWGEVDVMGCSSIEIFELQHQVRNYSYKCVEATMAVYSTVNITHKINVHRLRQ